MADYTSDLLKRLFSLLKGKEEEREEEAQPQPQKEIVTVIQWALDENPDDADFAQVTEVEVEWKENTDDLQSRITHIPSQRLH